MNKAKSKKTVAKKEELSGSEDVKIIEAKVMAVQELSQLLLKSFGDQIKAVWVLLRKRFVKVPEVTVIMLVDDTDTMDERHFWGDVSKIEKILFSKYKITFRSAMYRLTDYWEMIKSGSPIIFNEIREAIPIYDPAGFFVPFKKLIALGKVPGTREAMFTLIGNAHNRLRHTKMLFITEVLEHLFQSAIDAGQAPLLLIGVLCSPKHVAENLRIHFVENGLLEPEYPRYIDEIVSLWKGIEHGNIQEVNGKKIDEYVNNVLRLIDRVEELIPELERRGMIKIA